MQQDATSTCPACGEAVQAGQLCPNCQSREAQEPELTDEDVDEMLRAAAHSCDLRDFPDAKRIYQAILRHRHDNVEADIGLGNVYLAEGRPEEAVRWYRFALDADPRNPVAAERLLDLASFLSDDQSAPGSSRAVPTPAIAEEGASLKMVLRIVFAAGCVICLVAVLGFLFSNARRNPPPAQPPGQTRATSQANNEASRSAGQQASPLQQDTGDDESQQGAGTQPIGSGTAPETAFAGRLATDPSIIQSGVALQSVQSDPRTRGIVVTFKLAANKSVTRLEALSSSREVARVAYSLEPDASVVTLRALGNTGRTATPAGGQQQDEIVFVGDIYPNAAASALPALTAERLETLFSNVYWHPSLKGGPETQTPQPTPTR